MKFVKSCKRRLAARRSSFIVMDARCGASAQERICPLGGACGAPLHHWNRGHVLTGEPGGTAALALLRLYGSCRTSVGAVQDFPRRRNVARAARSS